MLIMRGYNNLQEKTSFMILFQLSFCFQLFFFMFFHSVFLLYVFSLDEPAETCRRSCGRHCEVTIRSTAACDCLLLQCDSQFFHKFVLTCDATRTWSDMVGTRQSTIQKALDDDLMEDDMLPYALVIRRRPISPVE